MLTHNFSVNFGSTKTGLTTVGYTLYTSDGTVYQTRTTAGITELPSTGIFRALISLPDAFSGTILWDTGEASPRYAAEDYNAGETGGGGYGIVVDNIWTVEEKKKLFDNLDVLIRAIAQVFKVQEALPGVLLAKIEATKSQLAVLLKDQTRILSDGQSSLQSQVKKLSGAQADHAKTSSGEISDALDKILIDVGEIFTMMNEEITNKLYEKKGFNLTVVADPREG